MGAIEYRVVKNDGEVAVLDELIDGKPSGDEDFQIEVTLEGSHLSRADFSTKFRAGKIVSLLD